MIHRSHTLKPSTGIAVEGKSEEGGRNWEKVSQVATQGGGCPSLPAALVRQSLLSPTSQTLRTHGMSFTSFDAKKEPCDG